MANISEYHSHDAWKSAAGRILYYTHFSYPIVLLVVFLVGFLVHGIITAETTSNSAPPLTGPGGKPLPRTVKKADKERYKEKDFTPFQKALFCWLSVALVATFVANAASIVAHALKDRDEGWWCGESTAIYVVGSAFLYALFLISLIDAKPSPTFAHLITWAIALVAEILMLASSLYVYTQTHVELDSLHPTSIAVRESASSWEVTELAIDAVRVVLLAFVVAFYAVFRVRRSMRNKNISREAAARATERTPLLQNGTGNEEPFDSSLAEDNPSSNGSPNDTPAEGMNGHANGNSGTGPTGPAEEAAFYRPTTAPVRSWWEYLRSYSLFFPYLWPSKDVKLQFIILVCFILIIIQRLINILVPIQIGVITDQLSGESGPPVMPWANIGLLITLKFLQGTPGLLGAIRSVIWIPISQYSYQALATAAFEHVHSLSLDFHLGKRTGEVLSALSKGGAINSFLEQITFQVLPTLFDLAVAIGYFLLAFDAYYALVLGIVTFWYLYITVRMAQWRSEQRRTMINADREEAAVKNDSIQSYETVKYFNAEPYEFGRYRDAVGAFQRAEYGVMLSLQLMNVAQNLVFMLGLLITSVIAAYQVTIGRRQVGQFVSLITYMAQLQGPLNFFGTFYRSIQSAMISGERLLELFKEQPTVVDSPDAMTMPSCEGQITFKNVGFSYDKRKPAITDLTFNCPPGTTTALVGESGGGKSTVFRLLFRFYNVQEGSIQVDGHDVRDVTIDSLRSHIGVVPQDTIMFNETIMYNLRYANQNATDEEIYAACRAASIHDKIMGFPDGYETRVGERGLRLSGGEKQRVAIARTILKNPRIIMLDEATAALDSETEQHIQEALQRLSTGRTMLVIAHRLSTITSADQIVVLHNGRVAEIGTHWELLAAKGRYAIMWRKQIRAEQRAAESVRLMSSPPDSLDKEDLKRSHSVIAEGFDSQDVSEDEDSLSTYPSPRRTTPPSSSRRAMGRAESLRGSALLTRGYSDDAIGRDGRTHNHHP